MFTLIDLPYSSLSPVISDETLSFHYGKHLQTYVDNLNKLVAGTRFEGMGLTDIVLASAAGTGALLVPDGRGETGCGGALSSTAPCGNLSAIFNNAGQILNHQLYFLQFKTPVQAAVDDGGRGRCDGVPAPTGSLLRQIQQQWGSVENFQIEFEAKGVGLFGSGWVWLSADEGGELLISQEENAGNPLTKGLKPLLTFDVWEHSYYLDYQNRRAAHLKALWSIIDWNVIETRYDFC